MPIYRRGKAWWYSITIEGKTYRSSCKTQDEKQAREFHDTERAKLWRQIQMGEKPRKTWEDATKRWLKDREGKKSLTEDKANVKWWTAKFQTYRVRYLDEVTPDVVAEIRDAELERDRERGEGKVKPATINRKISTLRSVMTAAARSYLWVDKVPLYKLLPENNERVRFLTPTEVYRLTDALPEPYRSLALFAVSTGLRRRNVMWLRWSWVDLTKKTVTLPNQIMKNGEPLTLPLIQFAIDIIKSWTGKHQEYVFCRKDGERINEIPSKIWAKACADAGIEDFRFHDLRHTWASLMRQNGVGLDALQELGGWKMRTMVQRYAHLSVDHLAETASVMDSVLAKQQPKLVAVQI
mgnify:CR=1 FL=1